MQENELAERLVNVMEWPIPYSMRHVHDAELTSQYVIVDSSAVSELGATHHADSRDDRHASNLGNVSTKAGSESAGILEVDDLGVPIHRAGVQVCKWLRVGSVRCYASAAIKHRRATLCSC